MKEPEVLNALEVVDGRPVASSLEVAGHFGKLHKDVIEAIRKLSLDLPGEFNERNFTPVDYTDSKGEKRPAFKIARDGFMLLGMGFTGKRALVWKLRYIDLFNAMEAKLLTQKQEGAGSVPPGSTGQTDTIRLMELALQLEIAKAEGRVTESDVMDTFSQLHDVTQGRPAKPRFRDVTTPMGGRPEVRDEEKSLTTKEAEEFLKEYGVDLSRSSLIKMVRSGMLQGFQLNEDSGKWYIRLFSIQDYITKHTGKIFRKEQVVSEQPRPQPVQSKRIKKTYFNPDLPLLEEWFEKRIKENVDGKSRSTELYEDFMAFARKKGVKKHITQSWFGRALGRRFPKLNSYGVHWYIGIQLK